MNNIQLEHKDHERNPTQRQLILMCDGIQSPANIGALFRLADAFAVDEIIFGGVEIDLSSSRLKRTARNTFDMVRFRESADLPTILKELQTKGYTSVAIEITEQSLPIEKLELTTDKLVLILGNERSGVSETLLELTDHTAHITMFGQNSSMNVAQATAIALYELRRG